ncbi:hypothetical protein AVEN_134944-1 [Araneus ventricosus]|uniref:Uncharacterized protein n=1 Tax=Araneus ventricosus TaxID=182803 RepID=A0A4Y2CH91_ARAVE|nr:hypothetical protein AVEN_134944-1 [Araneus ventricosus]
MGSAVAGQGVLRVLLVRSLLWVSASYSCWWLSSPSNYLCLTPNWVGGVGLGYVRTTPEGGRFPYTYDSTCNTYTADLQWNRVSSLELYSPEAYHWATAALRKG